MQERSAIKLLSAVVISRLTLQPKNYLDFITNYKRSLGAQRKEISETSGRLSNGLAKLVQASAEVDQLQKELNQAKVVVQAATQECNKLLEVRPESRLLSASSCERDHGMSLAAAIASI